MNKLDREEFEKNERLRVTCLNPVSPLESGTRLIQGSTHYPNGHEEICYGRKICGHGTGMTIEEMNENLIWKGRPYIRIPYCKYCYTENTVGVFDDTPELIGWRIYEPSDLIGEDDEEEVVKKFMVEKMSEEEFEKYMETRKKIRNIPLSR